MLAVIIIKMIIVVVIIESPVLSHQPLARSLDLVFAERKGTRGAGGQTGPLLLWKRSQRLGEESYLLGIVDKGPDPSLNASSACNSALLPEHGVFLLSTSTSSLVK